MGRVGESSLWHQLQKGQGLLVGRPTNQYKYTRAETSGLPHFTLKCSFCCGKANLYANSNSQTHVSDMLSVSAADIDTDTAEVATSETKGAQGGGQEDMRTY